MATLSKPTVKYGLGCEVLTATERDLHIARMYIDHAINGRPLPKGVYVLGLGSVVQVCFEDKRFELSLYDVHPIPS